MCRHGIVDCCPCQIPHFCYLTGVTDAKGRLGLELVMTGVALKPPGDERSDHTCTDVHGTVYGHECAAGVVQPIPFVSTELGMLPCKSKESVNPV